MLSLLNLKKVINTCIDREQDFIDYDINTWNVNDLYYHSGQIFAYNLILKEIDFILDK